MYKLPVTKPFSDLETYHRILSPEFPDFLQHYIELPIMQRLGSVGLLCGTDWTPLYHNRFWYSQLDHSIGTALIVWHFTHSKKQTVAALLHDVSTPAFSHVGDFRKGDALTQSATEGANAEMILTDPEISVRVFEDGLYAKEVSDYHIYPVCDNEIPRLSADRLEYMFPSGMSLLGNWTMEEVKREYESIEVLKNEDGRDELGFTELEAAEEYTEKFCEVAMLLLKNENKLALNLLGDILNLAVKLGLCEERDFFDKGEAELMQMFADAAQKGTGTGGGAGAGGADAACSGSSGDFETFASFVNVFTTMKSLVRSERPLEGHYCVSLPVKRRYINPLVQVQGGGRGKILRVTDLSRTCASIIEELRHFEDTAYGCVPLRDMKGGEAVRK